MFEASHSFTFFDYFRVPYDVPSGGAAGHAVMSAAVGRLRAARPPDDGARSLYWLRGGADAGMAEKDWPLGRYQLADLVLFGRVAGDATVLARLPEAGRGWRPVEAISDAGGDRAAAVWRDDGGNVFLPFDPGEVMQNFWSERYLAVGRSGLSAAARATVLRSYYLARPLLPRRVQLKLRRIFMRFQGRASFPGWPVEDNLHRFYAWLFALTAGVGGGPVPFLDPWPEGRSWALVLTHDVETDSGYRHLGRLRDIERDRGYKSSWNFVPLRYRVDDAVVRSLKDEGCEVGVHGLRHDGRDLESRRMLSARLPEMRDYARRWDAVGFRSPATQRRWDLMPLLGFDYDSSYSDTDPYEPQPGGCCTYLPYFNEEMVELPITMAQDHTLFAILQQPEAGIWLEKARSLRDRRGMVLVLTHPDYADDIRVADGYRRLLDEFKGDDTVWHALPRDVAAWWRDRAASTIRPHDGGWQIAGPAAAGGRVRLAPAPGGAPDGRPAERGAD